MIVRDDGAWLWLVTQPDHAALAGRLMDAWRAEGFPERPTRPAALFATTEHDIGWTAFDAAPAVIAEAGRPVDFVSAPTAVKHAVWHRALEVLPARLTYAAALIAQHALTIYRRYRADPQWFAFFAEMERERDRWFSSDVRPDGSSGGPLIPPATERRAFLQDYAIVATGDLLSLTFCNGWSSPQTAEGYEIRLAGAELTVAPDPFDGARVPIRVGARRVPNRRYENDEDLRAAIAGAREEPMEGVAVGRNQRASDAFPPLPV